MSQPDFVALLTPRRPHKPRRVDEEREQKKDQFAAIRRWNLIVSSFKQNMPRRKQRHFTKTYTDIFAAREAVDFLGGMLPACCPDKPVERSNCVALLNVFLKEGIVQLVDASRGLCVEDNNALLRIIPGEVGIKSIESSAPTHSIGRSASLSEQHSAAPVDASQAARRKPSDALEMNSTVVMRGYKKRLSSSTNTLARDIAMEDAQPAKKASFISLMRRPRSQSPHVLGLSQETAPASEKLKQQPRVFRVRPRALSQGFVENKENEESSTSSEAVRAAAWRRTFMQCAMSLAKLDASTLTVLEESAETAHKNWQLEQTPESNSSPSSIISKSTESCFASLENIAASSLTTTLLPTQNAEASTLFQTLCRMLRVEWVSRPVNARLAWTMLRLLAKSANAADLESPRTKAVNDIEAVTQSLDAELSFRSALRELEFADTSPFRPLPAKIARHSSNVSTPSQDTGFVTPRSVSSLSSSISALSTAASNIEHKFKSLSDEARSRCLKVLSCLLLCLSAKDRGRLRWIIRASTVLIESNLSLQRSRATRNLVIDTFSQLTIDDTSSEHLVSPKEARCLFTVLLSYSEDVFELPAIEVFSCLHSAPECARRSADTTRSQLAELLEALISANEKPRWKAEKLAQFKAQYPDIFGQRFPREEDLAKVLEVGRATRARSPSIVRRLLELLN